MDYRSKIIARQDLAAWRESFRATGRKLVVTNGCFDILHIGHVTYLEKARSQGDALLVGVNGDDSIRLLKGPHRPVNTEDDRAGIVAALACVEAACVFAEVSATEFLKVARPDVYVKGGDYTVDTINQEERRLVESQGGRIVILSFVPGKSTTGLIQKISKL
jgi:rfaE bifunctional protein nucleotidyltransferase chain/domain